MDAVDVVVIGDCNPDIMLSDPDIAVRFGQHETLVESGGLTVGGSGSITACACARLGLNTAFVGAVGNDAFGTYMLGQLDDRGVDTSRCARLEDVPTGFSVVLSRGEDRAILTHSGSIEHLSIEHLPVDLLMSARHVHISAYFLLTALHPHLPSLLKTLRAAGTSISIDTNWDPAEAWDSDLASLLRSVDLFLPNAAEACAIARCPDASQAARTLAAQTATVAVKLGSQGAVLAQGDHLETHAGYALEPVDTTGAGDAFNAGFLRGWLAESSPHDCLRLANAVGALSTQGLGAVAAQPDLETARNFIANQPMEDTFPRS